MAEIINEEKIKNYNIELDFLSGLVRHPEALFECEEYLGEEDFCSVVAKKVYSVIRHLIIDKDVKRPDMPVILATISNMGLSFPNDCNITDYVNNLYKNSVGVEWKTVEFLAREIFLLSRRRDMFACGTKFRKKMEGFSFGSAREIITATDEIYFEAINNFVIDDDMVDLGAGAGEDLHHRADNPIDHIGFGSGFPHWDRLISNLRPDSFNFVSGRGKVGKSMFGLSVAKHVAVNEKIPVFYADSEMSSVEVRNRLIANMAGVDIYLIETGRWKQNPETCSRVLKVIPIIESIDIKYYSIRASNCSDMISACRRFLFRRVKRSATNPELWNPCLFVWDYIKLDYYNEKNMGNNWWLDIAKSVVHFKDFLGKTQTTALVLGQQNQGGIAKLDSKTGKMISQDNESVVAGSDEIVKTASNVSQIRFKSSEEVKRDGPEAGNCLLMPFVARHGEGGSWIQMSEGIYERDYVSLEREPAKMTFKEITTNRLIRQKQDISHALK